MMKKRKVWLNILTAVMLCIVVGLMAVTIKEGIDRNSLEPEIETVDTDRDAYKFRTKFGNAYIEVIEVDGIEYLLLNNEFLVRHGE